LSNILIAHFPFKNPTTSDTENFGGIDTSDEHGLLAHSFPTAQASSIHKVAAISHRLTFV
jgi:hypothetical protein